MRLLSQRKGLREHPHSLSMLLGVPSYPTLLTSSLVLPQDSSAGGTWPLVVFGPPSTTPLGLGAA